jgi:hypothetical protein
MQEAFSICADLTGFPGGDILFPAPPGPMKILRATIPTAAIVLYLISAAFAHKPETRFLDRTSSVGGETYRYQVFVPFNWDAHKKWPVSLFLHGAGERGTTVCCKPTLAWAMPSGKTRSASRSSW